MIIVCKYSSYGYLIKKNGNSFIQKKLNLPTNTSKADYSPVGSRSGIDLLIQLRCRIYQNDCSTDQENRPIESVPIALEIGLSIPRTHNASYSATWPTLQPLHPVQLGEELVNHAVGDPRAVMAPPRSQRVKLIEEQNAWLGSLRPAATRGISGSYCPGSWRSLGTCDGTREN